MATGMSRRQKKISLSMIVAGIMLFGGVALANNDPLVGTWHLRDSGTSNIFLFVSEPVGGVYPVLYWDDFTGEAACNGDYGPMLWSGFMSETGEWVFEGSYGTYWCPDNGDGVQVDPLGLGGVNHFTVYYDEVTDTITGPGGRDQDGDWCVGIKQPNLDDPNEVAEEIEEGRYPPPEPFPSSSC